MAKILAVLLWATSSYGIGIKPMLIGGTKADPDQFKAVVVIKTNVTTGCLATVVGPRTILTTSNCASKSSNATFTIGGKTYTAVITYSPLAVTKAHPLALGVTTEDINVTPISLSTATPSVGTEVTLVGTGCTATGPATDASLYSGKALISEVLNMVFKSSSSGGPLICRPDMGGPALVQSAGAWFLLGVNAAVETDPADKIIGPNHSARVDADAHRQAISKIAKDNNVDVCGVTKECGTVPQPTDPTCTLSPSATSVRSGDPLILTLNAQNATSGTIDGVAVTVPTGTRTIFPTVVGSQQSTGVATNSTGKTASCTVSYSVTPKTDPVPVSCTLSATPSSLKVNETVVLELIASGPATSGSIDGTSVSVPSGKKVVSPNKEGDFSAVGWVSGGGSSANCYADYHVKAGGPSPTLPNYGIQLTYCGPDAGAAVSGITRVCMGVVKKDASANHTGFTEVVHVKYTTGLEEVLPIVARRPVGGSSLKDELGLFANGVSSGKNGATMDMRVATLTKSAGSPSFLEGTTKTGKGFRVTLSPQ